MDCVDLRALCGDRYRLSEDEAAEGRNDPWMVQLRCRYGLIYPYGRTTLAVEVDGHNPIANRLKEMPGVSVHQWGDSERTLLFDVSLFDQIAQIVQPRKRRRLTDEQRQALAAKGAPYRFSAGAQSDSGGPGRSQVASTDPEGG